MLFSEFYTQRLIKESVNNVPRKILGMSTSIVDLPERIPYGFWVDRSGNFLDVGNMQHDIALQQIVIKAKNFLQDQGVMYKPSYQYKELLDIGWMRVVLTVRNVMYQLGEGQVLTPSQQKFLKILQETYDKVSIVRDV